MKRLVNRNHSSLTSRYIFPLLSTIFFISSYLKRASEQFSVLKQQSSGMNRREEVLKKMAAAFDGFEELVRLLEVSFPVKIYFRSDCEFVIRKAASSIKILLNCC